MGNYLNPGNEKFKRDIESDIYVDKTGLIEETNKRICKNKNYICISRPRRFGKSVAAGMLVAYYSKGCRSKELFDGLEISRSADFEKHLNRFNVIRLDITNFIDSAKDVPGMIEIIENKIVSELKEEYPDIRVDGDYLMDWLDDVYDKTGVPFVFVIDELDCVMREKSKDEEGQIEYLRFLRLLFKDRDYVALCYMTGILPILKTMDGSMLNMFDQISIADACEFSRYTGFTEDEVKGLCKSYNRFYEEIESYYKG